MGFANFYRHFICNFSTVASPQTAMLKGKAKRLTWTEEAEGAFQRLKHAFTPAPIIHHPDPEKTFWVEVERSETSRSYFVTMFQDHTQAVPFRLLFPQNLLCRMQLRFQKPGVVGSKAGFRVMETLLRGSYSPIRHIH